MGQEAREKGRVSTQVSDEQEMGLAHLMAVLTAEVADGADAHVVGEHSSEVGKTACRVW
jgi:hypothetical protein